MSTTLDVMKIFMLFSIYHFTMSLTHFYIYSVYAEINMIMMMIIMMK